jgi:rubrerythrin
MSRAKQLLENLSNPSQYKTPDYLKDVELYNAVRQDIIAELDAVSLYSAHKEATDDQELKDILDHIIGEEKEHAKLLQDYLIKKGQWDAPAKADDAKKEQ